MAYEETFHVSWAHLDGNAHMANTSFMAVAIDCRFHYFATRGATPATESDPGLGKREAHVLWVEARPSDYQPTSSQAAWRGVGVPLTC